MLYIKTVFYFFPKKTKYELEFKNNQSTCLPHETNLNNLTKNYSKEKLLLTSNSKILEIHMSLAHITLHITIHITIHINF